MLNLKCPSRNVQYRIGYINLELKKEAWAGNINFNPSCHGFEIPGKKM